MCYRCEKCVVVGVKNMGIIERQKYELILLEGTFEQSNDEYTKNKKSMKKSGNT